MKSQNIEIMLLVLVSTLLSMTVNAGLVGQQTEKTLVAGEELDLGCDLDVEDAGLVVWKHGDRVLFAGNVRIRRDYRMAIINKRSVKNNLIMNSSLRKMYFQAGDHASRGEGLGELLLRG